MLCTHRHLRWANTVRTLAVLLNEQSALRKLPLHCTLLSLPLFSLCRSRMGRAEALAKRSVILNNNKKSAFCEIVGGPWKYLNLWKQIRLVFSETFLLLTPYKALYCSLLFFSSHGPRSVKPMSFTTTAITTSSTPMSLATRQPHSSGC